ncbi:hypothetical protein ACQ4M4_10080 [Leptolyngbya sp. AN02str]|uniref:hypothetical protein n=1 Tax=Leptolyngbya sp. AN02str TaxID=3423363 RepID=UPI003D32457B
MESLAYIHSAIAYESTEPAPEIRLSLWPVQGIPSSAWISCHSVLVALLVLGWAGTATATITGIVKTPGGPLNVRSEPNGRVIDRLPNGDVIELTGTNENGWLELTDGSWVYAPFIETTADTTDTGESEAGAIAQDVAPADPTPIIASATEPRVGYIDSQGGLVNIRSVPGGDVVTTVPNETPIELTGRVQSGWLERTDGTWVSAQLVRSASQEVDTTPAEAASPVAEASVAEAPVEAPVTEASPAATPSQAAITAAAPTTQAAQASAQVGYVNTMGNPLNVRREPSADASVIVGRLQNGDRVELTGNVQNGYLERTDGTWVMAQFIQTDPVSAEDASTQQANAAISSPEPSPQPSPQASPQPSPQPLPIASPAEPAASPTAETAESEPTSPASPAAIAAAPSPTAQTGIINTGGGPLNVRREPSEASPSIATLPNGSRVELTGRNENGYVERTNGTWLAAQYVTIDGTETAQPPTEAAPASPAAQPQPSPSPVAQVQPSPSPATQPQPSPSPVAQATPAPAQGSDRTTAFVRTNGSPLNVRNAPGGSIVGGLPNGSRVELTGRTNGNWAERTNGTWISSQWISATGVNPNPGPQPPIGSDVSTAFVRTNGSPLNVRSAPNGAVIGVLANGSRVELTGRTSGSWAERTNGTWISSQWVSSSGGGSGGGQPPMGGDAQVAFVRTNGSPLLIRSAPNGLIVGELRNNSRIELTGRSSGGWLQLTNGGWVSGTWIGY